MLSVTSFRTAWPSPPDRRPAAARLGNGGAVARPLAGIGALSPRAGMDSPVPFRLPTPRKPDPVPGGFSAVEADAAVGVPASGSAGCHAFHAVSCGAAGSAAAGSSAGAAASSGSAGPGFHCGGSTGTASTVGGGAGGGSAATGGAGGAWGGGSAATGGGSGSGEDFRKPNSALVNDGFSSGGGGGTARFGKGGRFGIGLDSRSVRSSSTMGMSSVARGGGAGLELTDATGGGSVDGATVAAAGGDGAAALILNAVSSGDGAAAGDDWLNFATS